MVIVLIRYVFVVLTVFVILAANGCSDTKSEDRADIKNGNIDIAKVKLSPTEMVGGETPADSLIWSGNSGTAEIVWTSKDLIYTIDGNKQPLFSWLANSFEKQRCLELEEVGSDIKCGCIKPNEDVCESIYKFQLASITGNYISGVASITRWGGTMLGTEELLYFTIDTRKPRKFDFGKPRKLYRNGKTETSYFVRLDELFSTQEILKRLLESKEIRDSLIRENVNLEKISHPDEIMKILKDEFIYADEPESRIDGKKVWTFFAFMSDFYNRFIILGASEDDVEVELGFPLSRSKYGVFPLRTTFRNVHDVKPHETLCLNCSNFDLINNQNCSKFTFTY